MPEALPSRPLATPLLTLIRFALKPVCVGVIVVGIDLHCLLDIDKTTRDQAIVEQIFSPGRATIGRACQPHIVVVVCRSTIAKATLLQPPHYPDMAIWCDADRRIFEVPTGGPVETVETDILVRTPGLATVFRTRKEDLFLQRTAKAFVQPDRVAHITLRGDVGATRVIITKRRVGHFDVWACWQHTRLRW